MYTTVNGQVVVQCSIRAKKKETHIASPGYILLWAALFFYSNDDAGCPVLLC